MKKAFNLADMFEMVADKVPGRDALICGDARATFAELDQRANQLAQSLSQLTYSHDIALVVLLEQLYRAPSILEVYSCLK